jgi:hypothetical protein
MCIKCERYLKSRCENDRYSNFTKEEKKKKKKKKKKKNSSIMLEPRNQVVKKVTRYGEDVGKRIGS